MFWNVSSIDLNGAILAIGNGPYVVDTREIQLGVGHREEDTQQM